MVETILWLAGGALAAFAVLLCFIAWLRFLDGDSDRRRDLSCACPDCRCHHKQEIP